jgi:hypothetical protein
MEIPIAKLDIDAEFLKLSESDELDALFAKARERFPAYQDEQLFYAIDYVMDGIEKAFEGQYSEGDWQAISDQLTDHVQNGLA